MEQIKSRSKPKEDTNRMIMKWFSKHFNLKHTSYGYLGMFGVWDVMGNNEIDQQVFVSGRTEHLIKMRTILNQAIDDELVRRKSLDGAKLL